MNPILYIRTRVFNVKQTEFAQIARVGQASVSRWEHGGALCNDDMRAIREEAQKRGLHWDDRWFFEVPAEEAA